MSAAPLPLHCHRFGEAAAEPLLLIHGLGSSGADWAFQIEPLARHFQVLVVDLPGAGRSPVPRQHSIAGYARSLLELLDALQLSKVGLMGFSLGGAVAIELALQAPERVSRLLSINSLPSYRADTFRKKWELYGQLTLVRLLGLRRAARLVAQRLFPHPHQAAMRERVIEVFGAQDSRIYIAQARALAAWCARERVPQLRVPHLMLAAEHDYTPLAEKRLWAQAMGAELRVVQGSRHGTPFDSIAATEAASLAFFHGQELPAEFEIDSPQAAPRSAPEVLAALQAP